MPGIRRAARLRKPREFAAVRAQGRTVHGSALALGLHAVELLHNQFGFVVGKRVGNAVMRNLVKRRLRAIVQQMQAHIAPGWMVVISAKPNAAHRTFAELDQELHQLMRRAKLWLVAPLPDSKPAHQQTQVKVPAILDPQEGSS